jgi:hypothetical protein
MEFNVIYLVESCIPEVVTADKRFVELEDGTHTGCHTFALQMMIHRTAAKKFILKHF